MSRRAASDPAVSDASPEAQRPAVLTWRPRITARARLTMVFTGLLAACGMAMILALYLVMRFVPTYSFNASVARPIHDPTATPGTSTERASLADPPASPVPGEDVEVLRSAIDVRSADDVLWVLLASSGGILIVLLLVGAVASWIVAGRLLKPVHGLTVAARIASQGSLNHRIGLTGPRDEFTELSDTFDDMLERLQRSFGAYERFAANASHELQTPLTTSKAILELAKDDPHIDVDRLIARLDLSNDRSIRTVEALLDLAQSTHGELAVEPVDLSAVITAASAAVQPEAHAAAVGVTVAVDPRDRLIVDGHAVLLERLFTNLLVNAVRHNVRGGYASITADRSDGFVRVAVSNGGELIDECTAKALTEPFFRGSGRVASSTRPRGHGLGLTLAVNIAEAHDAPLDVAVNPGGGLTVAVRFRPSTAERASAAAILQDTIAALPEPAGAPAAAPLSTRRHA